MYKNYSHKYEKGKSDPISNINFYDETPYTPSQLTVAIR